MIKLNLEENLMLDFFFFFLFGGRILYWILIDATLAFIVIPIIFTFDPPNFS